MDKFLIKFKSSEDALPQAWKDNPIPKAAPKRPVGRPKRKHDESASSSSSSKRQKLSKAVEFPDQDVLESSSTPTKRGQYKTFSAKQKKEVATFAQLHGVRVAAREFKISKSTVSDWCKLDFNDDDRVLSKKGHLAKTGRPITYGTEKDYLIAA